MTAGDPGATELETTKTPRDAAAGWRIVILILLAAAAVYSAIPAIQSIVQRLTTPWPLTPWESAIVVDAAKAAAGKSPYENAGKGGAATHLYGPLITYSTALVYKLGFFDVRAPRVVTFVSAIGTCAIIGVVFLRLGARSVVSFDDDRSDLIAGIPSFAGSASAASLRRTLIFEYVLYAIIAASVLLGLHYRGRAYFTESRPDMPGAFFATLSLLFAFRAWRTEKIAWTVAACLAVAVAFLFKQTYAVAAVIPPIAIVLTDAPNRWRRGFIAGMPFVVVLVTLLVMKLATPNVFHYAIVVPQLYHVAGDRVMLAIYSMFMHSPLYLIVAFIYAGRRGFDVRREPVVLWLFVATIIGSAAGCMAFAKRGGSYNSLLLGWIPMAALTLYALPAIVSMLASKFTDPVTRLGIAGAMGVAILATNLSVPGSEYWGLGKATAAGGRYVTSSANPDWAKLISVAKTWPGKIVSPTDPTIVLFAKGQFDRDIDTELDAAGRPRSKKLPDPLAFYLRDANWFIDSSSPYRSWNFPAALVEWGFKPVTIEGIGGNYAIWHRESSPDKKPPRKPAKTKRKSATTTTIP